MQRIYALALLVILGACPLALSLASSLTAPASAQVGTPFGDFDGDFDVDLNDFFTEYVCQSNSGPGGAPPSACLVLDADTDADIDMVDVAAFQNAFTGVLPPVCGNGRLETGEQCDDGNTDNADGCSSTCRIELPNDYCNHPKPATEGSLTFSTVGATTDGPNEPLDCNFFGNSEVRSDIWYCYTPACTGPAVISLCGSAYDTKLAVYAGCDCPTSRPLACSDDDCGTAIDHAQSRVTIQAASGESYLIRVGGYFGNQEQGQGLLTIRCGEDTCGTSTLSCTANHGSNNPGCDDPACCNRVCEVDTACCDVTWNATCAAEAGGFCNESGFPTCNLQAGDCTHNHNGPGCSNVDCCNAVCQAVPQCCIDKWDGACVAQFDLLCTYCGPGRGACGTAHAAPGCEDVSCCADVCSFDPFCCTDEWDLTCAQEAAERCTPN